MRRQHALIPAHVTLCRDDEIVAWQEVGQRLAGFGPLALTMRLGEPQVPADGCVPPRPNGKRTPNLALLATASGFSVASLGAAK